ncbi:hypothetical protein D9757_010808 [Collybiopsis confluens]|uniref:Uncharacterized protein n=1 Tax=Collybiopsis confluens TaxID=2823264 RepID=A0A8H5GUF0_9AGAR|nr:hypothetical protein D9757_010808 [Collybiopsis confluens]
MAAFHFPLIMSIIESLTISNLRCLTLETENIFYETSLRAADGRTSNVERRDFGLADTGPVWAVGARAIYLPVVDIATESNSEGAAQKTMSLAQGADVLAIQSIEPFPGCGYSPECSPLLSDGDERYYLKDSGMKTVYSHLGHEGSGLLQTTTSPHQPWSTYGSIPVWN